MRSYKEYVLEHCGLSDLAKKAKIDLNKYDPQELKKGLKAEKEHKDVIGNDEVKLLKIVLAHLNEDPHYYKKLNKAGLE